MQKNKIYDKNKTGKTMKSQTTRQTKHQIRKK